MFTEETLLHSYEQRGTLIYQNIDYTYTTVHGWFYLQNGAVIMRKINGRNRSQLVRQELVVDFTPSNKKGE
jgi:hypothetical protein